MNFRKQNKGETISFQMAPMIDVIFLLLAFFIASQIFAQWETEVDITLPTAQTGDVQPRLPGELIINVNPNGVAIINGQPLNTDDLRGLLTSLAESLPGTPVLLRADKTTDYEHIMNVLDLCRQSKIWNISFATSVPEN